MKRLLAVGSFMVAILVVASSFSSLAGARVSDPLKDPQAVNGPRGVSGLLRGLETTNSSLRMGLVMTLVVTILAEFYVYATAGPGGIGRLFLASVLINTITNPALNIIYMFYKDVEVLEYVVSVVESYMIFVLFNVMLLNISLDDATDLSFSANKFSYELCKQINDWL